MTSSKKLSSSSNSSSKKKSMLSLRDFDPENEDFGSEVGGLIARNKKGASLQHGHLGDFKETASSAIGDGFDDKKYAGKTVSRKELFSSDEEEEDEEINSDDVEGYGSEFDSEDSEEMDSDSENQSVVPQGDSGLSARMRELEMGDESAFELVSQARPSLIDDAQKSQHLRNQMVKFDDYVDLRFKLQPLLNSFNRLPVKGQLVKAKRRNPAIDEALKETVGELEGLMKDLLELSVSELKNDLIQVPADLNPKGSCSKMQSYWDEITRIDAALDPFARTSLQKWHNKMTLATDMKSKKTLKMLNQDPYQQVQIALQDEERLVSRTRIFRDSTKRRLGCAEEAASSGRIEYDDIYDDNDFYQVLLKDWTASHGALSSTTASAMSAILLSTNKKQHRENVDQRASKGRKIRYDVHAKLINYMVPQIEKGAWNDSKIDEFYASLLGQSKQQNN